MDASELGTRLQSARKDAVLTQAELGQLIGGVNSTTVSKWETGRVIPDALTFAKACKALGYSSDELLGLVHEKEEHVGSGLKWRVVPPRSTDDPTFKNEVDRGIDLFKRIVVQQQTIAEIQADPEYASFTKTALRRLLTIALFSQAVQIVDVEQQTEVEAELAARYKLRHCAVARLDFSADTVIDTTIRREAVAFLAARDTLPLLANAKSVGLSGGTTISRFVDLVPPAAPQLRGVAWFSLLASRESMTPIGASGNSVVARMVYKQPGATGHLMPFISATRRTGEYAATAASDELEELRHANMVRSTAASVEIAFVSVGAPETNFGSVDAHLSLPEMTLMLRQMSPEQRQECVGDVLLYFIDHAGNRMGSADEQATNDAMVYSVGLDGLRRITDRGLTWIVAAQPEKAPVVHACLTAGLANCLVIETVLAEALLKM